MTTNDIDQSTAQPSGSRWTGGRVAGLVFASLAGLVGVCMLLGGVAVIIVHGVARDDDGFYTSDKESLRTGSYAITTDRIAIDSGVADDLPEGLLEQIRVEAEGASGGSVFLGIGPSADVERYLADVARARFVDFRRGHAVLEEIPGRAPRSAPAEQPFWVATSEGTGERRIDWDPDEGSWAVAVMNADGSREVAVDAAIGVRVGWLIWVGVGLMVVGLVITGAAILLIVHVSRRAERDRVAEPSA